MVDKELIGIWRNMIKPTISSLLLKTNYEGMGKQGKEEFERDFDEILDLALIGLKSSVQPEGMDKLTFSEYQKMAQRTMVDAWPDVMKRNHALHGMVSEIGELHGIYQKMYQGHMDSEEHRKKELGDLMWFMAEYCTANGWDMGEIAQLNIDKLIARYPDGFDCKHSLYRSEGDI